MLYIYNIYDIANSAIHFFNDVSKIQLREKSVKVKCMKQYSRNKYNKGQEN